MSKADRIVSYFPSFYRATQRTKLLYDLVDRLAAPIEEADSLLFRIQRAHRLKLAEHATDILHLATTLNLTPFHFEDILADPDLPYADRLARMRERVWRVARIYLTGLGTPWAVMEMVALFLDATIVPARAGAPLIRHLDAEAFSHVATIEFSQLPDRPRERIELHENPLLRRKLEPVARWPLDWWTITNQNLSASPVSLSIQAVGERTVRPSVFCPDTGESILFNGMIPEGKTLVIDPADGARIDGVPVNEWVSYASGGIFEFASADSTTAVVETGREDGSEFDGDLEGIASQYQPRRPVPSARVGQSRWYFNVTQGVYDGTAFDFAVFEVPPEPIGTYDGDFMLDACRFDYPASGVVSMAWDERQLCAFKLLLPATIPRPKPQQSDGEASSEAAVGAPEVNYAGRIGTILPRFKAAGIRAYVDSARDAWILGESVLRSAVASEGEGVSFHSTRLYDPRSDMFVDVET